MEARSKEVHFLSGYQRALGQLPTGSGVYIVFQYPGASSTEPAAVFTDYASADLWRARRPGGLTDYVTKGYTVERDPGSDLTMLRVGAPSFASLTALVQDRRQNGRGMVTPLPSDREIRCAFDARHVGLFKGKDAQ